MARPSPFTEDEKAAIKEAIFNGLSNVEISKLFGTSSQTITNVKSGRVWAGVPWPDGSTGPLSEERKAASASRSRGPVDQNTLMVAKLDEAAKQSGFRNAEDMFTRFREDFLFSEQVARMPENKRKENPQPITQPSWSADTAPKIPWEEIVYHYSDLSIVANAELDDDEETKQALQIVFASMTSEHARRGEQMLSAVREVKRRMK